MDPPQATEESDRVSREISETVPQSRGDQPEQATSDSLSPLQESRHEAVGPDQKSDTVLRYLAEKYRSGSFHSIVDDSADAGTFEVESKRQALNEVGRVFALMRSTPRRADEAILAQALKTISVLIHNSPAVIDAFLNDYFVDVRAYFATQVECLVKYDPSANNNAAAGELTAEEIVLVRTAEESVIDCLGIFAHCLYAGHRFGTNLDVACSTRFQSAGLLDHALALLALTPPQIASASEVLIAVWALADDVPETDPNSIATAVRNGKVVRNLRLITAGLRETGHDDEQRQVSHRSYEDAAKLSLSRAWLLQIAYQDGGTAQAAHGQANAPAGSLESAHGTAEADDTLWPLFATELILVNNLLVSYDATAFGTEKKSPTPLVDALSVLSKFVEFVDGIARTNADVAAFVECQRRASVVYSEFAVTSSRSAPFDAASSAANSFVLSLSEACLIARADDLAFELAERCSHMKIYTDDDCRNAIRLAELWSAFGDHRTENLVKVILRELARIGQVQRDMDPSNVGKLQLFAEYVLASYYVRIADLHNAQNCLVRIMQNFKKTHSNQPCYAKSLRLLLEVLVNSENPEGESLSLQILNSLEPVKVEMAVPQP